MVLVCGLACAAPAVAQVYFMEEARSVDSGRTRLIVLRDQSHGVEAAIAPDKGGELSSLRVRFKGKWLELLYGARDYGPRESWTGKAPLLWPATGRNFPEDLEKRRLAGEQFDGGAWNFGGKRYAMPIHGFARDMPWRVERTILDDEAVQAILSLEDTVETAEFYPFRFKVRVEYWLSYGNLELRYSVLASQKNSAKMPFSIGNHITFVTPLVPGSRPGDVVLETPSERELLKTAYGVPTGESRPRSHVDGIRLGEFERRTAVSLTGYRNNPHMILKDPQGLGVRISHSATSVPDQPVILFNMWGDAPDGFFSPEPWVGLQNSLVMGKGLTYLAPGEVFKWTVRIETLRGE